MPEYNLDRIGNIRGEINSALSKLDKIKKLSKDDFLASQEKIDSAKYNLIVVTEGASDICNHIAAKAGGRSPQSYSDCFSILEELGLFSPPFIIKLKEMARFRNLLVHLYWKVDNNRIFEIIQKDMSIIREYLEGVDTFILQQMKQSAAS